MPRPDAERMAFFRKNKRGALVSRLPATGSSLPGGSLIHMRGRKQLLAARRAGKAILCRASDGAAIRAATFDEVIKAYKSPTGEIITPEVISENGVTWGCVCVIRNDAVSSVPLFDPTPRLVRRKR